MPHRITGEPQLRTLNPEGPVNLLIERLGQSLALSGRRSAGSGSFAANRNEDPADVVTASELVHMLGDVVEIDGNPLIGVGPLPDGGSS